MDFQSGFSCKQKQSCFVMKKKLCSFFRKFDSYFRSENTYTESIKKRMISCFADGESFLPLPFHAIWEYHFQSFLMSK